MTEVRPLRLGEFMIGSLKGNTGPPPRIDASRSIKYEDLNHRDH